MEIQNRRNNLITILLFVLLCGLSAAGIYKTIYFSADIDESYALTMAYRIASGERLLVDMWEPHQMSAALYAPLVFLYKSITGSMEGALIFMRAAGLFVQALVSVFLYRTVRCDMPSWLSLVLAFAYFNFTPKHIASPEFSLLFYWAFMALMLCLIRYMQSRRMRWVVAAGAALCVIVLCYPSALLLFVYLLLWLLCKKEKADKKAAGILTLTCALGGVAFVVYLLIQGGGFSVLQYVSAVLMDESHNQNLIMHMWTHLKGIWELLFVILSLMVLFHVGRPVLDKKKKRAPLFLGLFLLAVTAYAIWQFHTIQDVNFMIFYPVLLQVFVLEWYAYGSFEKSEKDRIYFESVFWPTTVSVIAILLSSNVLTAYSMSYFMPGAILGTWQIYRVYSSGETTDADAEPAKQKRSCGWMAVVLLVCVVTQLFAARICLVRFTSTQKKNVFEPYYEVNHGVLRGIRLGDFDYIQYEAKNSAFDNYVEKDDSFLYVGADMFLYSRMEDALIATGNTISTPGFGEQLMHYYEVHPERIPTVVFVDREYGGDFSAVLQNEPMKTFMESHFDMEKAAVEAAVTVYKRER